MLQLAVRRSTIYARCTIVDARHLTFATEKWRSALHLTLDLRIFPSTPNRRAAIDIRRSSREVSRAKLNARGSKQCLTLIMYRSTLDVRRSTFDVRHSTFDVRCTILHARHCTCTCDARLSPQPRATLSMFEIHAQRMTLDDARRSLTNSPLPAQNDYEYIIPHAMPDARFS
jgi:hypothetical protein